MKHAFLSIILMALLAVSVQADITVLGTDDYLELNLSLEDIGAASLGDALKDVLGVEVGVVVAVDYFVVESQPFDNYEVDLGDNYVGPYVKLDLLKDAPVIPYVAYKPMIRNSTLSDWYHVFAAGVGCQINDSVGVGMEWQHCRERGDNDIEDGKLLFTGCFRW